MSAWATRLSLADPLNSTNANAAASQKGGVGGGASPGDEAYARRVGSTIKGKWRVDALLGVGGMAAVYAATHRNNTRAALKVLHADFARDKQICDRFLREAYVSNKIGHPACVTVLDDDSTEEGEPYLVMELLEGETLRDLWKKTGRRMQVEAVLRIVDPILDCLVACHAIGVIHRDLKPANIFITDAGDVKVLDFGVAQMRSATAERTATGTALGTPHYMSPEQAMGLVDKLDGRADLFSVGAMIHALVTGQRINNGRTENEALILAATKPAPSIARIAPELSVEIVALVDKALAWDARNRFADAREMQTAVRKILGIGGTMGAVFAPETGTARAFAKTSPGLAPVQLPAAAFAHSQPAPQIPLPPPTRRDVGLVSAVPSSSSPSSAPGALRPRDGEAASTPAMSEVDRARVAILKDLFKHVDRLLPSVRQLSWDHPATNRALRTAFEAFVDALLRDAHAVNVALEPYSFTCAGEAIWEPAPPFDVVPYNLFSAGVREMRISKGVTLDELRSFLAVLLMDPARDLPPEDDLVAALWERAFTNISYEVADTFAEGDAAAREAFYDESDAVEKVAAVSAASAKADSLEARAMAVSTDRAALRGGSAGDRGDRATGERAAVRRVPLAFDSAVRTVLALQLDLTREMWSDRYVDALIEGYLDAATNRDAQLMLASLRKSSADLSTSGRLDVVCSLHQAACERLAQRTSASDAQKLIGGLTNAMFGGDALELALRSLETHPDVMEALAPVLDVLSPTQLPSVLRAFRMPLKPYVRDGLVRFVERVLPGREADLVAAIESGLETEVALTLLRVLSRSGTPASKDGIGILAASNDLAVRIEAKVLLAGSADALQGELASMLEDPNALTRMGALVAIRRHGVVAAWPAVSRQVRAPGFHDLGLDEKRELFRALFTLGPDRGEATLLEIVRKGGVFSSESKESTRTLAAEILGELSRSLETASALREIGQARWGTSEETRERAARAAGIIASRSTGTSGVRGGPSP